MASGNRGLNVAEISPAGLSGALTVAAIGQEDERMAFSNWGNQVDIAAAGTHIVSLRADKKDLMQFEDEDYKKGSNIIDEGGLLYHLSGTSFAAPHVAGLASLLFSINPKLTAAQVRRMILQSATDIDTPGADSSTGYGELNAVAALKSDPDYYIEAMLASAQAVSSADGLVLQVVGSAAANKLGTAWLELGQGDIPKRWKKVGTKLKKPVHEGILFELQPTLFGGRKLWTLRLVVQHKDGSRRTSQLPLQLG